MKKKPFILIEVLIAFSFVLLCIVPLIRQPLKFYQNQINTLEKMELERLADWTFTEVKEILLKNSIPWGKIPEKHATTGPFQLPPALLDIPGCNKKKIKRSFTLIGIGEKIGTSGNLYRQIKIKIALGKKLTPFFSPSKN